MQLMWPRIDIISLESHWNAGVELHFVKDNLRQGAEPFLLTRLDVLSIESHGGFEEVLSLRPL